MSVSEIVNSLDDQQMAQIAREYEVVEPDQLFRLLRGHPTTIETLSNLPAQLRRAFGDSPKLVLRTQDPYDGMPATFLVMVHTKLPSEERWSSLERFEDNHWHTLSAEATKLVTVLPWPV
jgi:hypothetical protein